MLHHFRFGQALAIGRQRARDGILQLVRVEVALDDVVVGAGTRQLRCGVFITVARQDNGGAQVADAPHLLEHVDRRHLAELIVEEDEIGVVVQEFDQREIRIGIGVELDLDGRQLVERSAQELEFSLVIIDGKCHQCF